MNSEHRFTLQNLLDEGKRAGFRPTQATVSRFVTLGLLDQAESTGRGYKGGVRRTWSENQRQMFLTVLDKQRTVTSPAPLLNIPVGVWVYWGDEFAPLRQVRRALETFSEVRKDAPRHDYARSARKLVRDLARSGSNPRAKQVLVDTLVRCAQDRVFDTTSLRPLLIEVVGPSDRTAQTDGPRALGMLEAQWAARTRFFELTDGHFRWARMFFLYGQESYARDWQRLAGDPRFGQMHIPFDFEHVINSACQHLLFLLGLSLVHPPSPDLAPALQLQPWLEGRAHMETSIEAKRSPLWLPGRKVNAGLSVEVRVWLD